jgi:hypothetical protein
MMAVGGDDVGVAVQAQEADGQAAQRCHDVGCVSCSDQGLVFLVGDVADPVELVFYMPVAPNQGLGRRAGTAVAGDEVDDLDGFLAIFRVRAADRACGCRIPCHLMRPGSIRGSGRRAGPAAGPGYLRLRRADSGVRRAGSGAAPCAADGCCCDTRSHVVSELVEEVWLMPGT